VAAKLLVVSGPLRRSEFPLAGQIGIGREAGNFIRLEDPAVSPQHCRIAVQNGRTILEDLESASGTFVNGIPVKQRDLKPGDEVAVGNSVFVFETDRPQNATCGPVEISEREVHNVSALEFQAGDLFTLGPQRLAALPRSDRTSRNLSALIYICKGIGCLRDEESLPWQLLSMIFDVIPADRGAILLLEDGSHEVRSHVAWDRAHGPGEPVHVSRSIVRRVVEQGVSLLSVRANTEGEPAADDREEGQRSFLSVPLLSNEKPIGLIYLESTSPATGLSEDDFRLLTAISSLGAIAIENARQFERLGS